MFSSYWRLVYQQIILCVSIRFVPLPFLGCRAILQMEIKSVVKRENIKKRYILTHYNCTLFLKLCNPDTRRHVSSWRRAGSCSPGCWPPWPSWVGAGDTWDWSVVLKWSPGNNSYRQGCLKRRQRWIFKCPITCNGDWSMMLLGSPHKEGNTGPRI